MRSFVQRLCARLALAGAVVIVSSLLQAAPTQASIIAGFDVSFPNCTAVYPTSRSFAIVGVNHGHPFSTNPCLQREWSAAQRTGRAELYMNIVAPNGSTVAMGASGPAGSCSLVATLCRAYNYGFNAAKKSVTLAIEELGAPNAGTMWWLDVEFSYRWSTSRSVNARSVAGAIAYFRSRGRAVGVYSTSYQWRSIVGSYHPGIPIWYATSNPTATGARLHCTASNSFTGGAVRMVQYAGGGIDADARC